MNKLTLKKLLTTYAFILLVSGVFAQTTFTVDGIIYNTPPLTIP